MPAKAISTHVAFHFLVSDDAPKTDMAGGGVDRLGVAGSGTIAPAVIRRAQMRAAFDDLAGNFDGRLARIVTRGLGAAARVFRNGAGFWHVGFMLLRVPVGGPFPDIADHVVNAIAVGRERRDRGRPLITIVVQVLFWKFALPGIGLVLAAGREFIAPGIFGAVKPAARAEFPFGFPGRILSGATFATLCNV